MSNTKVHPIRAARLAAKLTQLKLAQMVDVEFPTISHWESGRHLPRPAHALALIKALPKLTLAQVYAKGAA